MMRILFLFIFISMLAPNVSAAQEESGIETPVLEAPKTLDEAQQGVLSVLDKILAIGPGIIKDIWRNQAVPLWQDMWIWVKVELWQNRFQSMAQNLFDKGMELLGREVEQRRPIIEQELQQEKQELAQDIARHGKNAGKGLWERFLDLFRDEEAL